MFPRRNLTIPFKKFFSLIIRRALVRSELAYAQKIMYEYHWVNMEDAQTVEDLSVVIPSKNMSASVIKLYESLKQAVSNTRLELIIVDNQSTDLESSLLRSYAEAQGGQHLEFPEPFNFSKMVNMGVGASTCAHVLVLNNDVILESASLNSILNKDLLRTTFLSGLSIRRGEYIAGFSSFDNGFWIDNSPSDWDSISTSDQYRRKLLYVDGLPFHLVAFSRDAFFKAGQMNTAIPVGLGDVDFSLRARRFGFAFAVVSDLVVVHEEFGTRQKPNSIQGFIRYLKDLWLFSLYSE